MEFDRERAKIVAITTLKGARNKMGLDAVGSLLAGGIDALLVMLINNNVGIDVLRWIGIAVFGIAGVKNVCTIIKDLFGIGVTSVALNKVKKEEYTINEKEYSIK